MVSRECLTVIDHKTLDRNKIFLTADASDRATGAVLSFGPTWETARLVAYDSKTLKDAELNYPTHEKELLAILHSIQKWKVDLLGSPFLVYTDHKTLLNFHTQRDMSRRQAHWMEELSIYGCKFVYVKGTNNSVADALSRYPYTTAHVSSLLRISLSQLTLCQSYTDYSSYFFLRQQLLIMLLSSSAQLLSDSLYLRITSFKTYKYPIVSSVILS